jgi:hypothetical protein
MAVVVEWKHVIELSNDYSHDICQISMCTGLEQVLQMLKQFNENLASLVSLAKLDHSLHKNDLAYYHQTCKTHQTHMSTKYFFLTCQTYTHPTCV